MSESTNEERQHPDDAAVAEVRGWLDGAQDEDLIELEARTLSGVLAVLDGWEQNARTAVAQRNTAYGELEQLRAELREPTWRNFQARSADGGTGA